jgi:hypothetical protein
MGAAGGAPGELQVPLGLAATCDGGIVVSDVGNRAWINFTPTGGHIRNVPVEGAGFGFPSAMYADPPPAAVKLAPRRRSGAMPADRSALPRRFDEHAGLFSYGHDSRLCPRSFRRNLAQSCRIGSVLPPHGTGEGIFLVRRIPP